MARNKRKLDLENADEKEGQNAKNSRGKRLRNGAAMLAICAAAFGAYYSPDFRSASSGWFERWRDNGTNGDVLSGEKGATGAPTGDALAQAPSFRDFLTEEYGEEEARELLGIAEPPSSASMAPNANWGFADYVAAENAALEPSEPQGVASGFDALPHPANSTGATAPELGRSFADYVAAENGDDWKADETNEAAENGALEPSTAFEPLEPRELAPKFDALSHSANSTGPTAPEPGRSFADYVAAENGDDWKADETNVAAENGALEPMEPQGLALGNDALSHSANSTGATAPEPGASFADYVAAENGDDREANGTTESVVNARLATAVEPVASSELSEEDETARAARLEAEMKERGVGNPRIERWGGRFWRASGFATTDEGVATFCEAVDVDPAAAQRAALAKFEAANF